MLDYFKARINKLITELEEYEQLRINADNEQLAERAGELGKETLAQIWQVREQMEIKIRAENEF